MVLLFRVAFYMAIIGIILNMNSRAYSQSTPPLDKPIEKPPLSQMTEEGRIQEKIDKKRLKKNSPDSDINHPQSPNIDPAYTPANVDDIRR
ncbi:hypothetical protein ABF87_03515 [Nitrosomonas sp. JL21]|uniref:hypothetical protein n=1 Tax=Nitrosomonas sp. JL21 TaxID=153949 RepID=UPI00136A7F81|nr:hypothetical protein [Nitrosomonas sp. JL21]MBL8496483.1 hypothetical protein [Nitrosomonas sp.]MXS77039.1 hypothetical protein [Nitrosomonas sp. JL21]